MKTQQHRGITWIDVENPDNSTFSKLQETYHLLPIHLKESVQKVQHTQVEREDTYLFLILHVPVFQKHTNKIIVSQVGIFLGKDFLITTRTGPSPVISDLFTACEQAANLNDDIFKQGSASMLHTLIDSVLGDISSMTENVLGELDDIEDLVFDNNGSDAQRIGKVRQKIVRLRRVIGPKRIVLQDLTEQIDSFTGKDVSKSYSNTVKTTNRLWEIIEEAKETVEIYKDADFTTSTEQTNEILAVLTLLFTFTIPVTVVGTLYGMNVPLPGGIEAGAWSYFGRYTTFGLIVTLSAASALAMYLYFKKKNWF